MEADKKDKGKGKDIMHNGRRQGGFYEFGGSAL